MYHIREVNRYYIREVVGIVRNSEKNDFFYRFFPVFLIFDGEFSVFLYIFSIYLIHKLSNFFKDLFFFLHTYLFTN